MHDDDSTQETRRITAWLDLHAEAIMTGQDDVRDEAAAQLTVLLSAPVTP